MKFMVGDVVKWKSQANSYSKTKIGTIIQILPAGKDITTLGINTILGLRGNATIGFGGPRKHDSYIVRVGNQAYWPRVKHLTLSEHRKN